jgi:hypothetical protein
VKPFPRTRRTQHRAPEIDVAPIREAFEQARISKGELANRLGWTRPNIDQVNRALGYRPDSNSRGRSTRQRMSYTLALRIAEAMNVDPVDLDL